MQEKQNIRLLNIKDLEAFFVKNGEQKFRSKQLWEWIWKKNVFDFEQMTNLPVKTRSFLKEHFYFPNISIVSQQISTDKTIKNCFQLHDGKLIEGVLIPAHKRMTACISSQVGCSLSCAFCATGKLKRLRNLEFYEIFDQVVHLKKQAEEIYKTPLTNIVYMGMGEPLLNYKNVLKSIEYICSENGLGMSPKRITLSTAGIAKMIKQLADDGVRFNLALSLHAANDTKRSAIMAINRQNNLMVLKEALTYFYEKTQSRITLEYILFNGFNDSIKDASELAAFAKHFPCKINIIEYNPVEGVSFQKANDEKTDGFVNFLQEKCNLIVNVRRSRGKDIDAACGQLANKV